MDANDIRCNDWRPGQSRVNRSFRERQSTGDVMRMVEPYELRRHKLRCHHGGDTWPWCLRSRELTSRMDDRDGIPVLPYPK